MDSKRYTGQLKKWNADRGFGFIVASDGGQDVFVHISAFARDGRLPNDGELLTFELEPDHNGKRSAVRVRRQGDPQPELGRAAPRLVGRTSAVSHSAGFVQKLIVLLILAALAFYAYGRYTNRVKQIEAPAHTAVQSPAPVSLFEGMPPAAVRFTCDGRNHCSQMKGGNPFPVAAHAPCNARLDATVCDSFPLAPSSGTGGGAIAPMLRLRFGCAHRGPVRPHWGAVAARNAARAWLPQPGLGVVGDALRPGAACWDALAPLSFRSGSPSCDNLTL